jgi:hypothetical protein
MGSEGAGEKNCNLIKILELRCYHIIMDKSIFIPLRGFRIYKNGISVLAQQKSISKTDVFFSNEEKIIAAKAVQNYLNAINNLLSKEYENAKIIRIEDFQSEPNQKVFYKYVSRETLEKYILKGRFRLGTLENYQKTTNTRIQDELEGFVHIVINYKNRQLQQALISGFNYLIFCGSYISPDRPESKYLKENFGDCVIKIKNPRSFMQAMANHLNSRSFYYLKV